jgi:hypothetical protein
MRLGRFFISDSFVEDYETCSEVLSQMKFVPIRVEHLWGRGAFEYVGHSLLFEEIEFGSEIPEYAIIFREQEDGEFGVVVNKHS